ncbi:hypothetical protein V6Z77_008316 [Aspergillus fumigatus]
MSLDQPENNRFLFLLHSPTTTMTKDLSFDVYFSNEQAHASFGDGKTLVEQCVSLPSPSSFMLTVTQPPRNLRRRRPRLSRYL